MNKLNKILLVDDDELFNYIHQEILKKLQVTEKIEIAVNGKEALKHFENKENYPDLVLLDIDMPIMNGFEFLNQVTTTYKEALSGTKIIMLTSSFNQRDIDKANEYHVSGYLNKPLSPEKFNEVLSRIY